MRCLLSAVVLLLVSTIALGQEALRQSQNPLPPLRNHHILLVPSSAPGTGEPFWIAVAPDGQLATLPVSQLQAKMGEGYRPFTFGEFQDALTMLMNQNAALSAEVKRTQAANGVPSQSAANNATASQPSQTGQTQTQAQVREQQRRQAALMFLMSQRAVQPYQVPVPAAPRAGVNCVTRQVGNTTYTDCH